MTVVSVVQEPVDLTASFTCEFPIPPEEVWQLWSDPRLLERWWGPPGYPAAVQAHDLVPGGVVSYVMTSPEGEMFPGGFRCTEVEPPRSLVFEDYFADEDGNQAADMPSMQTRVEITPRGDGVTVMAMTSIFPSVEAMQQLLEMGAVEGMAAALGQIDELLPAT